jgi:hypothetical protein
VSSSEYTTNFHVRRGKLILGLNFTKTLPASTITVKNTENVLYSNPLTHQAELIFIDSSPSLKIIPTEKPSESLIQGAMTSATSMTTTAEVLASGGAMIGMAAIFLQFPIAGAIIRLVLVFKILNRLRLININSGGVLGSFLANVYNLFEYGNAEKNGSLAVYSTKTRGKLTQYRIYVTPFIDASHLFYLYFVSQF